MPTERTDRDGWPVDDLGRRTDPIGRVLEVLTPEQRKAWGATCSENAPRIVVRGGVMQVVYPTGKMI